MSERVEIDIKRLFQTLGAKEMELTVLRDKVSDLFQETAKLKDHIKTLEKKLEAHENH